MNELREDIKEALRRFPLSKDERIHQALDRWQLREFGKGRRSGLNLDKQESERA